MENKLPYFDCDGVIVSLRTSTTPYDKVIADAAIAEKEICRSDMQLSPEELDVQVDQELEKPKIRCLLVGLATRNPNAIPNISEKNKELQGTKVFGVTKPNNITEWDEVEPPLMVVTPITTQMPEQTKLYALLKPEEMEASAGLWKPYTISQGYVFNKSRYRSNATNAAARKKEWTQMITWDYSVD
jgi:hypothetical protein